MSQPRERCNNYKKRKSSAYGRGICKSCLDENPFLLGPEARKEIQRQIDIHGPDHLISIGDVVDMMEREAKGLPLRDKEKEDKEYWLAKLNGA